MLLTTQVGKQNFFIDGSLGLELWILAHTPTLPVLSCWSRYLAVQLWSHPQNPDWRAIVRSCTPVLRGSTVAKMALLVGKQLQWPNGEKGAISQLSQQGLFLSFIFPATAHTFCIDRALHIALRWWNWTSTLWGQFSGKCGASGSFFLLDLRAFSD